MPAIKPTRVVLPRRPSIWELDSPLRAVAAAASSPSAASAQPSQSLDLVVSAPAGWKAARECGQSLFGRELLAKGEASQLLTLRRPREGWVGTEACQGVLWRKEP